MSKKTTSDDSLMIFIPKPNISFEEANEILADTRKAMAEKYKNHEDFTKKFIELFGSGEDHIKKIQLEEERAYKEMLKSLNKLKL